MTTIPARGRLGIWRCAAALMILSCATTARADGLVRGSLKDSYMEPVAPVSWSGFYIGLNGGVLSAATSYPGSETPEQNFEGALLGFQAGYNWQFGRVVAGIEADVGFGKVRDFVRDGSSLTQDGEISSFGSVRARLGYAFGNFLPYITGGFMWARLEQGLTCPSGVAFGSCAVTGPFDVSVKETMVGWTLGAGAEYAISGGWSLKGEVLFGDFDSKNFVATLPVVGASTARVDLDLDYVARLGINYRF